MIDQEIIVNLDTIVCDNNNREMIVDLFETITFHIFDSYYVPTFCQFVDCLCLLSEKSSFKNLWRINCSDENFVQCSGVHFTITKIMDMLFSTKNRVFKTFVGPSETTKSQLIYNWFKNGIFQPQFGKNYFCYQHSQPLFDVMQKQTDNPEFVQGVDFEFRDSLKNNGTMYLLVFDKSCQRIQKSKSFGDYATAGRRRGLSTFYKKHNLSHQSIFERHFELHIRHLVLFKSPRDVVLVSALGTQLGLGSVIVAWYGDATSVPYGHLLINWLPRTDDRLRYCTNTGSIPPGFCIPDRPKPSKRLDDDHTKSLDSPSVPTIFPQKQEQFTSVLSEKVYPVSRRLQSKSSQQRKDAKHKITRDTNSIRSSIVLYKKNHLEARNERSGIWKRTTTHKLKTPPVVHIFLDMEQFVPVPACLYNKCLKTQTVTKQELPKYQAAQNPTYEIASLTKQINKTLFSRADSLVGKYLSCPLFKLSNSQTLILDGVETGVLLSDFAQWLRRKNADDQEIHFSLLDAAVLFPTLILNQSAKTKERGSWIPFKIWTSDAAKNLHAVRCCLLVCAQFIANQQASSIKG